MRFRSPAEARGLRLAGHERKGRRHGRPIINRERKRQGHDDFHCPSPHERCRTGRAMNLKEAVKKVTGANGGNRDRTLQRRTALFPIHLSGNRPESAPLCASRCFSAFYSLFSLFPPVELPFLG